MTTNPAEADVERDEIATPVRVMPRHDVHPIAYIVTNANIVDIGARLGLTVTHLHNQPTFTPKLEIPFERRYNLASQAQPGDAIIVHPMTTRNLEILPGSKYAEQYQPAEADLVDTLVREEFPDAHAWAIIVSGPRGVNALPGSGIVDAAHLIGIATLVARAGRARS